MSVTSTMVTLDYTGNGVTTDFPIPFTILDNDQVLVSVLNTLTGVSTLQSEGLQYTIVGGDPGTTVRFTTAPASTDTVTVYRSTAKTQIYEYIETGTFKAEDHEKALDRIVMMIQELDLGILSSLPAGTEKFTRATTESVADGGTISLIAAQRILKDVQGSGGVATVSTTTGIAAGTVDGQELRLVGASDTNTLTILDTTTNVKLNGTMTFKKNSVMDLFYDLTEAVWKEVSRRD